MRNLMQFGLAAALSLLSTGPSQGLGWQDYSEIESEVLRDLIMVSMGQAFLYANFEFEDRGIPLMYCQPENLGLTGGQYDQIATSASDRHPPAPDTPVELILLEGLKFTFPC